MKRLIIITNGTLPVPAVCGGAVEQLTQSIIDENERRHHFDIVVFTSDYKNIKNKQEFYKNSDFFTVKTGCKFYIIKKIYFYILKKIGATKKNAFINEVIKSGVIINEYDFIVVENNPFYILALRETFKKNKILLHLHNDYINVENYHFSKAVIMGADLILTVSKFIKDRVDNVYDKSNTRLLYNGIDIDAFKNNSKNSIFLKKKYNISNELIFLYTGRIEKSKGVHLLIGAFEKLGIQNSKLLIVGDYENSELKDYLLSSAKNNKNIIPVGYVKNNEISDYYHLSDIGVFPSLSNEAFGLTVLEAISSSLPVIISDAGGMQEVIDESCGLIVKKNNELELIKAMVFLASDQELRESMGIKARERSKKFSVGCYNNEFIDFVDEGRE